MTPLACYLTGSVAPLGPCFLFAIKNYVRRRTEPHRTYVSVIQTRDWIVTLCVKVFEYLKHFRLTWGLLSLLIVQYGPFYVRFK